METRRNPKTPRALTEAELEEHRAQLVAKEAQLREQTEMFHSQREEFQKDRETRQRDFETIQRRLAEKELELSKRTEYHAEFELEQDRTATSNTDMLRELQALRAELEQVKHDTKNDNVGPSTNNRFLDANTSAYYPLHDNLYDGPTPRVSYREALETVPGFDGKNISLTQFLRACRRAKEIVPPSCERNLTRLLINKLRGRAYYAVEDEPCDSIAQLSDILNSAFGTPKTIHQYRGELSSVFLKANEHMLDYIIRVKDLRTAVLDAERRQRRELTPAIVAEIDALTASSFCDGLPLEYRIQLKEHHYSLPFEAFSVAKTLAKRAELDKERREPAQRSDKTPIWYSAHPIGRPLAHSTPAKQTNPYVPAPRRPTAGYIPARQGQEFPRNTQPGPVIRNYPENPQHRPGAHSGESPRYNPQASNEKVCRYCKKNGHEIQECRKRQYNNARLNQGNSEYPSRRTDEPRAGPSNEPNRPVKIVTSEVKTEQESRS